MSRNASNSDISSLPMLQMSAWTPSYCFPSITSGAVYTYEPQFVLRSSDFFTCRAKPKSVKKGDALYHRMIIIWYYNINRYSRISKNTRHIHVYIVNKALVRVFFFFGGGGIAYTFPSSLAIKCPIRFKRIGHLASEDDTLSPFNKH